MIQTTILLAIATLTISSCKNEKEKDTTHKQNDERSLTEFNINAGDTVLELDKNIRSILQDKNDNYWFGSDGEGVYRYDGKTLIKFSDKDGLCNNQIRTIQEDKSGNIWFGTGNGVSRFDGKTFSTFKDNKDVLQSFKSENLTHKTGDLVFGDNDGFYNFDGNILTHISLPETSPIKNDNHSPNLYAVYCTFKDSKGNLWFGTDSRGVCKFDGKTFTWLDNKELGLAVRSIFEDKNGNIWIGNNGFGLFHYDGKTLTNFTKEHKLENPDFLKNLKNKDGTLARVWTITEDKDGNLWIGTIDAGAWKYDGKTLTNYTTNDGLVSNAINIIYKDKEGNLWFGTDGGGVSKYDGKTFTSFTIEKNGSR